MKNQVTLLLTCLMILNMQQVYSQNDTLVAPADVVISHKFKVDLTQLKDQLDTTFVKITKSIELQLKSDLLEIPVNFINSIGWLVVICFKHTIVEK